MSIFEKHNIIDKDFVKCKICEKDLEKIDNRHLKIHETTLDIYKLLYPNEPTLTKKKLEKELISIKNRRDSKLKIEGKTKKVPCYYHNEIIIEVNINHSKFGLCKQCKLEKKILPGQKKAIDSMRKTIKEKFGINNISNLQSVVDKRKIKWNNKTEKEKSKIVEKREETILDKFGVDAYKELHKLSEKGMLEKYGFKHALQVEEFVEKFKNTIKNKTSEELDEIIRKIKTTKLERYGNENFVNREKTNQTNLIKYGGSAPTCDPGVIENRQINNIIKYGVKETLSLPEVRKRINITNLEKGWPSQREEVKEKIKETYIKNYGVDHFMKSEEFKEEFREREIKRFLPNLEKQLNYLDLELIDPEYLGAHIKHNFKCKKCNTIFKQIWNEIQQGYLCPICFPRNNGSSIGENQVADFVEQLGFEIIKRSRKIIPPKELDIFVPDKKIAIEFCGLYYHSEDYLKNIRNVEHPRLYHYNKVEECEKIGIRLITIFEDEWIYKKEIVIKRLEYILKKFNGERINGRDCEIKEVDYTSKNNFLETYHIQGKDNSNISIGGYHNSKLVSIMTFSKGNISKGSHHKEGVWELNRFCSDSNYIIPGISSRLLEYFKRNYEWNEIYSYADRRWSSGNLYIKLGFSTDSKIRLNYWYVKNYKRIHRFNLRKKPDEPKDITEKILRLNEGYGIVWDCGTLKFTMKK